MFSQKKFGLPESLLKAVAEAMKSHTVPKTEKEKKLAALAEPKDKITHADVLTGRGVKKEETELDEELTSDKIEKHNQLAVKHRALAKSSGGDTRVAHQRAANLHAGAVKNPWYKKGSSDALSASKKLGVTMEETELTESHFKVGDEVVCKKSGMEGEVVKVDSPQVGKYYTVKQENGKMVKYAPDELTKEKEDMKEEIEELEELSKSTLGSYVKKRVKQLPAIEVNYQMAPDEGGPFGAKRIKKYQKKVNKGIGRAVDRLTKEEVEDLDELNKSTLDSYADKAEKDIKDKKAEFVAQGGQMRKKSQRALDAKISNRYKGLFTAQRKAGLPIGFKEEVEDLDELSTQALTGYETRARFSSDPKHRQGAEQARKRVTDKELRQAKARNPMLKSRPSMSNEEVEDLDEMGPGKLPRIDKKVENEYGDKLMKDFLARGGVIKQVKSPELPKNRNRFVARGSLSSGERTVTKSGGKSFTGRLGEEKDTPGNSYEHQCAVHVKHSKLGEGRTLFSQHAEPSEDGSIDWYDVMFEHGIERVMTSDIEILVSESHMNHKKKGK